MIMKSLCRHWMQKVVITGYAQSSLCCFLLKCIYYPFVRWIQTKEKHCVCQLERWRIWECWRHRVAGGESSTMKLILCLYCSNLIGFSTFLIFLMYLFVYPGLSYISEHEGLLLHQPGWSCWRYLLQVFCKTLNQSLNI